MSAQARYARTLFSLAAAFNVVVAAGLVFFQPQLAAALQIDPATGSNAVLANLSGGLIATFGYAYACIAADPLRYRSYVMLGIVGKLLVLPAAGVPWWRGDIGWQLPALAGGDLLFVLLFLDYLRRSRRG